MILDLMVTSCLIRIMSLSPLPYISLWFRWWLS